ncbi:hypothetical protein HU230_0012600 [Bradyrhizobium quebecense]|uniref:Uncharacterized protein n=1 Tax=Bradyrhizobium quebecense TaxID=2748629 RepID=A0A974ACW9_9BRAD|nr:hypothetical protein [Bradyrhizobium quebecense]UGA46829.1 hypothetical protein HU230_0012600 [Bradyrhizobium quebecense]
MKPPGHDTYYDHPGRASAKPHKGVIRCWTPVWRDGGYRVNGIYGDAHILTSRVTRHDFITGEIETMNSRYKLDRPGF